MKIVSCESKSGKMKWKIDRWASAPPARPDGPEFGSVRQFLRFLRFLPFENLLNRAPIESSNYRIWTSNLCIRSNVELNFNLKISIESIELIEYSIFNRQIWVNHRALAFYKAFIRVMVRIYKFNWTSNQIELLPYKIRSNQTKSNITRIRLDSIQ